jgi:D-inositol-3-phosphate glycosyltransferase
MANPAKPLHVLFAAPAYWPATAFGGPIPVMRELAKGLVQAGCTVDVVTTSLTSPRGPRSFSTRVEEHEGSTILYAATPVSYRWMGITPTLPLLLERRPRPDAAHVFGFRDPVGTTVAAWCRARRIPYAFEALGMFRPKLRKIGLKQALDASVFRHVPGGAARLIACSRIESDEYIAGGVAPGRIDLRPNGFPGAPAAMSGALRSLTGTPAEAPLVLSVGRIASGKGLDLLIHAVTGIRGSHLAIVGPDDGHGTSAQLQRLSFELGIADRVHLVGPLAHDEVMKAYADADVVALASAHESFGMVAAEAAAAGTAILVTDRCGVAELLADAAFVVPYDRNAITAALERLLADVDLRARLGAAGRAVAASHSWDVVVTCQEEIYRQMLGRS